jgi:hypothetical protein
MAKELKVEDIDLPDIGVIESGGAGTDLTEFEGHKAKLWKYEIVDMKTNYDEKGELLPAGQTMPTKRLKVYSEQITEFTDKEGKTIPVYATEIFSLKQQGNKWGISNHEKAKIQKLLTKLKVQELKQIIGKTVIVRVRETAQGGTYLGFYTG